MSSQWLYGHILAERPNWEPSFALQSTLNWVKALSYEISEEHGHSTQDQLHSCQSWFAGRVRRRSGTLRLAPIFGTMFHSLTFTVTLASLNQRNANQPWIFPTAIVCWYYGVYHALRSVLASHDGREPDTHSQTIKAINDIHSKLPHPLNMIALHQDGERYAASLPTCSTAVPEYDLSRHFTGSRAVAQGMLLSYLSGTAGWNVGRIKEGLKVKHGFTNFKTKEARAARDQALPDKINFLNCAYRYRGKANYRDSLFLCYGQDDYRLSANFIDALFNVCRFCFTCAIVYATFKVGAEHVCDFLRDTEANFRGRSNMQNIEGFWLPLRQEIGP